MPLDLAAIKARLTAATPGPWTFEDGDDDDFCSAVAICAPIPASERQQTNFAGDFNARAVVALTLWQNPRIAVIHDARWDENAWLIAHAPTDIAALVEEVERLRAVLDSSSSALTEIAEDIRRELWLDEQDFRGHKLYDRIMDALPALDGGEVSGG